eukprot:scaffold380368_cov43-Attheya_sp.AAC.1
MVKRVLPRNERNGWNVQKFHEMFHLIHDMTRYGSPMHFDSGTGEKFHKFNAKMPAATAQLQSQVKFQFQSSQRWYESQLNQYTLTRFGHKSITFQNCVLNREDAESEKKIKPYSDIFPISPLVVLKCIPIPDNDVAYVIDCCYHTKSIGSVEIHPPTKVMAFVEHIRIVNTQSITDTHAIMHSCA